jgi:DNA replication protein DnaC
MKKQCKCGATIDLDGLEEFAEILTACDSCAEKNNLRIDEERRIEREDAARALRLEFATKEWEKVVPLLYRQTDVNHANYPRPTHATAMQWISSDKSRSWLGIIGQSGRGKTRVMSQIIRNRIWNDYRCQWVNATQFQWCAQNQHDKVDGEKAKRHIESYRNCGFLAFDDLGKQKWTNTVESYFWDLIEHRYAQCLPMVWTSNSSLEELAAMLSDDRSKAIIGRLAETSNVVEL